MNKGQFRVPGGTQKDYTLAFKTQVVEEVEKGLLSQNVAQRTYGIQGNATILAWLRKYGRLDWEAQQSKAMKMHPNNKIQELEKPIKRLEAEKQILDTAIDMADQTLSTNNQTVDASYQVARKRQNMDTKPGGFV